MTELTQAHQGNWLPGNYARIQAALAALPPPAERGLALAAVFDFDNTCVFRDIGQALFRVQMLHLRPIKIDSLVDTDFLARQTPGFSRVLCGVQQEGVCISRSAGVPLSLRFSRRP